MEVVNTVGRRKAAVARVYVKPGKGTITVNHKPMETYFPLDIFQYVVKQPLLVLENPESYDITINLTGGGIHGQAEAARLGIATRPHRNQSRVARCDEEERVPDPRFA